MRTKASTPMGKITLGEQQFLGHSSKNRVDSDYFMDKPSDIRDAANRLQSALQSLEGALDPLIQKVNKLEKSAKEAGNFEADRASLAAELDEAKAREKVYKERQGMMSMLADETTKEIDRAIKEVQSVLTQVG